MALFRRFFFKKPPDGLLTITDNIYVFDHCFSMNVLEEDRFEAHIRGIATQLRENFHDDFFMVSNFGSREKESHIFHILSEYDMTVLDYPGHYEGCPLLTMEMVHCFLKSSESWLSLGQHNFLLMHSEQGGWPVLAFMLAALVIYLGHYSDEQKTLDMLYKQASSELLEMFSPLNSVPSQLRYLRYVSMRNVMPEWPPADRAVTLDCVILRMVPNFHGQGGFRPIFRIYGPDPLMPTDQTPKVLFSTPKKSRLVRFYSQADELVKINLQCHVQGDVVLECINLDEDLDREEMVFRIIFNTAFIRSNILMLNRDQIDTLWNVKEQFPKDFRAEVIFSDMDATTSHATTEPISHQEKQGLGVEEFAKVLDIFNHLDWLGGKGDAALHALQQITSATLEGNSATLEGNTDASSTEEPETFFDTQEELDVDNSAALMPHIRNQLGTPNSIELKQGPLHSASIKVPPKSQNQAPFPPQQTQPPSVVLAASKVKIPKTSASSSAQSSDTVIPKPSSPPVSIPQLVSDSTMPISSVTSFSSLTQHSDPQTPVEHKPSPAMLNKSTSAASLIPLCTPPPLPPPPPTVSLAPVSSTLPLSTTSNSFNISLRSIEPSSSPPLKSSPPPLEPRPFVSPVAKLSTPLRPPPPPPPPPPQSASVPFSLTPVEKGRSAKKILTPPPPPPPPPPLPLPPPPPFSHCAHPSIVFVPSPSPNIFQPPPPFSPATLSFSPRQPPPPPPPPPLKNSSQVSSSYPQFVDKVSSTTATHHPPPPPPLPSSSSQIVSKPSTPPIPLPQPPPPLQSSSLVLPPSVNKRDHTAGPRPPPPPPPLRSSSSHVASVPPAPPLLPSKLHGDTVPQKLSPIRPPPPPGPPPKVSSNLWQSKGSDISSAPPPPTFSFSAKDRSTARSRSPRSLRANHSSKRAPLKPLHWVKVTRATQGSLWAETQKSDEASRTPEIDMSELESLFSVSMPNTDRKQSRQHPSIATKQEKVHLIDLQRSKNCEIMLRNIKIPLSDLMSSVLALDDSIVDGDQVDTLIKFCPTKEEMELLSGYTGNRDNLGKCEQFFLEMMTVPRVESKLRILSFKIKFLTQVADLKNNLNTINSVAEEVRNSVKLRRIMQTILSLGNALNQGTARGAAIGFRLDSLLKLIDIRARNNRMTLMHYLCKVLADKLPEVLDFDKDLAHLEPASKIQLKELAEEMQAITKGLDKVEQELAISERDGPASEIFYKKLKEFLADAQAEGRSLALLYSAAGKSADSLAHYFGEDPVRCPFEQVVSTLLSFVRTFRRADTENLRQIELEKKRAEMEAEREKVKLTAHKKGDLLKPGI